MKRLFLLFAVAFAATVCRAQVVDPEPGRLTADGPYIIYQEDGSARIITVGLDGSIIDTVGTVPQTFNVVSHDGQFSFDVRMHKVERQSWNLTKKVKTFILSDPHGRMDCLVSILKAGGVIDENLKWSFGPNRLVMIGDVMDRGDDVTQIFWLLYELELEAAEAGGSLTFVYGNHEPMVLAGDLRYTRKKYKDLAKQLQLTVPKLYGKNTEIGNWLAHTNTMVKVGDDLFVHAGLSKDFAAECLSIPEVNELYSRGHS
jgi:Calcineurin-like phosphoesterase.